MPHLVRDYATFVVVTDAFFIPVLNAPSNNSEYDFMGLKFKGNFPLLSPADS